MAEVRYVIFGKTDDPDAFRELGNRMVEFVKENGPETTAYAWYLSEDGHTMNEDGFPSTADMQTHLTNAKEHGFLDDLMSIVDISRVSVFGDVDDAARDTLAPFGAVHYTETASL